MFKSVFLLISPIARSKSLCLKFAHSDKGASRINFPSASLTDSNPRTFRISSTETRVVPTCFFCPTEKPDRVLASKSQTSRLFHRINKALFDFKPNALEPGIQRHGNAFICALDPFEPSRVTRYRLSIAYLVDPQPIKG